MRPPRRTFAAPLVVTLAACSSPSDKPREEPHYNPPPMRPDAAAPAPEPPDVIVNPPPPQPQQASGEHSWRLTKTNGKCQVFENGTCPPAGPGHPIPPCNPPPPHDYACPANMADGASETIVQHAGQQICMIPPGPMKCPEHAACNPPPPRQVPCP